MTESHFASLHNLGRRSLRLTRYNPPGQPALFYRFGTYETVVSRMLIALHNQEVIDQDNQTQQPLSRFNVLAKDDWTVAFMRAWATVSDVLSFYQERIINEGYLRTATERRSVLELTRAIGYELSPPISATTNLAFAVHDDIPGQNVPIPAGTAVQSIPAPFSSFDAIQDIVQGEASPAPDLPVIFETTADLLANPNWNALKAARVVGLPWPAHLDEVQRSLRLSGVNLGLKPGDGLLVVGDSAAAGPRGGWEFLLLSEVDPHPGDGYTAVAWEQQFGPVPAEGIQQPTIYALRRKSELFPYVAGAVFRSTDLGWAPTNIGLPPKPVRAVAANRQGRLFVGIEQTVFSSRDRGDSWQPIASGLPPKDIHALATSPAGAVAVGSDDSGVYLSRDGGDGWTPLSDPGEVEVPTGWRRFFQAVRPKLPKTTIRALLFTENKETELLAGSDDGVFGYNAGDDSWSSMNGRFPDVDRKKGTAPLTVNTIAALKGGKRILAGTGKGIFLVEALFQSPSSALLTALLALLAPGGLKALLPGQLEPLFDQLPWLLPLGVLLVLLIWLQPVPLKLLALVLVMVVFPLVGCFTGSILGGRTFETCMTNLPDATQATTLLFYLITTFLIANFFFARLTKLPDKVQKLSDWVKKYLPGAVRAAKLPQVLSILVDGEVVYAGTDHGIFQLNKLTWGLRFKRWWRRLFLGQEPEEWTEVGGWFEPGTLSDPADQVVTALALDGHGHLMAGTQAGNLYVRYPGQTPLWMAEPDMPLASIRAIIKAQEDTFALGQPLDAPEETRWAPAQLDAGAIDVAALSLAVAADSHAVALDGESSALFSVRGAVEQASRDAKLGGLLTRLTVKENAELPRFNRAETQLFCRSEPLVFFDDQFLPHPVQGDQIVLAGQVSGLQPGKLMVISGMNADGQQCSEPVTVKAIIPGDTKTILRLIEPLVNTYERESLIVYGNIVPAIHGQTIRREHLGESDGTIPNQRFLLHSPLAFEPAAANDYKSSLAVFVNDIAWKQVPTLLDQPPDGRVFMVRRNDQGQTVVIFGDGEQGARLPTSREKLTATYRSGGGPAGNVPPHSLTLLHSHLPRLKEVTNPIPAQGGQPAESAGQGRRQAPRRLRALRRIVTLKDYADFAATFPGVSKSRVHPIPSHAPRRIDIVIVPRHIPYSTEAQSIPLLKTLADAIEECRSSPTPPVNLCLFRPVQFTVGLTVHIQPELWGDQEAVDNLVRAVRATVLEAFNVHKQELGLAVTEAQIFQLVQPVYGVKAVTLNWLRKLGPNSETEPASQVLELEAGWHELLLLDEGDLKLEIAL